MELLVIATALSICLSVFLSPSAALQIRESSSSLENAREEIHFSVTTLPRKLRLLQDVAVVEEHGAKGFTAVDKQKPDASGKAYHKQQKMVHASRAAETWHEWVEGTDTSQFFTMDYSHVRRRRPIHNKALPVGP